MRNVWVGIWIVLGSSLAGAQAPGAPAAGVDRSDPVAVARAWRAAAAQQDVAAMEALAVPDKHLGRFLKLIASAGREGAPSDVFRPETLSELALLPGRLATAPVGAAQVTGDQAVVNLSGTILLQPKLVLRRQPDGAWAVDLPASFAATAGGQTSLMGRQWEMVKNLPDQTFQQVAGAQDQPWECLEKMRQVMQALHTYAAEHDGQYPLAAVWMDALAPYLDGDQPFRCPSHQDEEYSFAFNLALSEQKRSADWQTQRKTVVLACTGQDTANAIFQEADLAKVKGRHGQAVPLVLDNTEQLLLRAGSLPADAFAEDGQTERCSQRLSILVTEARKWAAAHGGKLPSAATWMDDLEGQAKAPDGGNPFVCPTVTDPAVITTYAINPELAGKSLRELVNHRKYWLFVEIEAGERNAVWSQGLASPRRHRTRWNPLGEPYANQVMLDGSVRQVAQSGPGG